MSATFKTEAHGGTDVNSNSTIVSKPSGTVDGDLLIASLTATRNVSFAVINSVPSGWTQIDVGVAEPAGAESRLYMYYKIASSEPSTWTWGWDNSNTAHSWGCFRIDSFNPTGYIDVEAMGHDDDNTSPSYTNTITPSKSDSLLIMTNWFPTTSLKTISGQAITTSNPTWTEAFEQSNDTGAGTLAMAYATRTATTATGNSTATVSGAGAPVTPSISSVLAIKRIVDFSTTTADTTVTTDTLAMTRLANLLITETIALVDTATTTVSRIWNRVTKQISSWTFGDKTDS